MDSSRGSSTGSTSGITSSSGSGTVPPDSSAPQPPQPPRPAEAALVVVERLDHCFSEAGRSKPVLQGIDLTVTPGEIVILTGPSGSGKTTLLTMLGGLRAAQTGRLTVLGADLLNASRRELTRLRRRVGFIFQAHNLLPYLTALENVRVGLEVQSDWLARGRPAMDLRAEEVLADVGLQERVHYHPARLSGGQKQRVAIARALAAAPPLLLADEPTAALDRASGRDVVALFRSLADERRSGIVMVTHDNRILDIADRIVNLEDGRLVAVTAGQAMAGSGRVPACSDEEAP